MPPVAAGRNIDHVCIATSPYAPQDMRDHLARHDVTIVREATQGGARGVGHSFYILGPFDNKLDIKEPAEYPDERA